MENKIIGMVSGGFDPIHPGHVRMIQEAKQLCDHLIVIINNDNWLKNKKGYSFLKEEERLYIIQNIKGVDSAFLTEHTFGDKDTSICQEIKKYKPNIFFNGGDRKSDNIPEYNICEELGIKMIFDVGGEKIQSSSELVKEAAKFL